MKEIPDISGYYWVKLQSSWPAQIVEYVGGVVYIIGSRERYSPYYDVKSWHGKVDQLEDRG